MIRRVIATCAVLGLVLAPAAWADDIGAGDEIVIEEEVVQEAPMAPVTAPPPPWVSIQSTSIGAGIGVSWGDGLLSFEGEQHPFSVTGLSLGDFGFAVELAEGQVQNLNALADFEGRYLVVAAGGAAGIGGSVIAMRNGHGVVINVRSEMEGVALSLGAEGLTITLE